MSIIRGIRSTKAFGQGLGGGFAGAIGPGLIPFGNASSQLTSDAQLSYYATTDTLEVGTPSGHDAQLAGIFSRFGQALDSMVMIEAGTAKDSGIWFVTDGANADAAIFLDSSDANKLKIAVGDINTDADRITSTVVTIEQDGDVGIGTASPGVRLHVAKNAPAVGVFRIENTAADGASALSCMDNASTVQVSMGYANASYTAVASLTGLIYIYSPNSKNLAIANPTQNEFVFGLTTGSAFFEIGNGASAAVSPAGKARLRLNGTSKIQASVNGGAYADIN